LQLRLRNVQSATSRELECGEFDPLQIAAIVSGWKLAQPKIALVFDGSFRSSPTHARAGIELCEQVHGHGLPGFNGLGGLDQLRQLMRAIVLPRGRVRGGLGLGSKAQVPSTILWPVQQVVDFVEISRLALELMLDHKSTPGIRASVAHCARDAIELGELEYLIDKWQLKWFQRDRIRSLDVSIAIAKAANLGAVRQRLNAQ
jgi:hypothetical protein